MMLGKETLKEMALLSGLKTGEDYLEETGRELQATLDYLQIIGEITPGKARGWGEKREVSFFREDTVNGEDSLGQKIEPSNFSLPLAEKKEED